MAHKKSKQAKIYDDDQIKKSDHKKKLRKHNEKLKKMIASKSKPKPRGKVTMGSGY